MSVPDMEGSPREALRVTTKQLVERKHTMTQDKSALLAVMEQLQGCDGGEVMRRLLGFGLQMLVDARPRPGSVPAGTSGPRSG